MPRDSWGLRKDQAPGSTDLKLATQEEHIDPRDPRSGEGLTACKRIARRKGRQVPMLADPPIAHVEVDLYLHMRVLISIIRGLSVTRLLGRRRCHHRRTPGLRWRKSTGASDTSRRAALPRRGRRSVAEHSPASSWHPADRAPDWDRRMGIEAGLPREADTEIEGVVVGAAADRRRGGGGLRLGRQEAHRPRPLRHHKRLRLVKA
jgi:hypothetical protein